MFLSVNTSAVELLLSSLTRSENMCHFLLRFFEILKGFVAVNNHTYRVKFLDGLSKCCNRSSQGRLRLVDRLMSNYWLGIGSTFCNILTTT